MKSPRTHRILTNNPLVQDRLGGLYPVEYHAEPCRALLVRVRDLVYAGCALRTHPLAGSVKPNETPYRSVVMGLRPGPFSAEQAAVIASAIETFDKLTPRRRELSPQVLADFQLVDYALLCGALDLDAAQGRGTI